MAKKKETNTNPKRRTQVKELPKEEKQLSKAEQKKIKGGAGAAFLVDIANRPNQ